MIVVTSSTPVERRSAISRSTYAAGSPAASSCGSLRPMKRPASGSPTTSRPHSAGRSRPKPPARLAAGVTGTAGDVFGALFELATADFRGRSAATSAPSNSSWPTAPPAGPPCATSSQAVAKYYRVPQKVLKSSSRRQSAVTARAMAVYLARELAGLSYERIGHALGGRDHTTIMHNYRKIAAALDHDAATRDALADLRATTCDSPTEAWKTVSTDVSTSIARCRQLRLRRIRRSQIATNRPTPDQRSLNNQPTSNPHTRTID